MRNALIIFVACAAVLAASAIVAWFVLFETPQGRRIIISRIEAELGEVFGGKVTIGALEGRPPSEFSLADIEVSDAVSVWLQAEHLAVDWRPMALLSGKISINTAALEGVDFLRKPASSQKEEAASETRSALRLPADLPKLSIRSLTLTDIRVAEAVTGRALVMAGAGAARAEGGLLMLRLEANSGANGDFIDASVNLDSSADHGYIDVVIASEAEGAIASLLNLGGQAYAEIEGEGPLSDFQADLVAEIGAYGAIDAKLAGNLLSAKSMKVNAGLRFGERLAALARDIGPSLSILGEIAQAGADVSLTLSEVRAEAGALSGAISWSNRGNVIEAAHVEFDVDIEATHFEDIRNYLGSQIAINADAKLQQRGYLFDARLASPKMTISLSEGQSDLRSRIAGRVNADLSANEALPTPFDHGARVTGEMALAEALGISFSALDIALPDGSNIAGAGTYGGEARTVSFKGDVSLSPAFINGRVDALTPTGPLLARVTAAGTTDSFSVNIEAESAGAAMNKTEIPAAEISVQISGLPGAFAATLSAQPIDRKGRLTLLFKQGEGGSFAVPRLLVESPAFTLSASGAWNAASEIVAIDLKYAGGENAQPYPGLTLSGTATAKGELGRGAHASELRITGEDIVSDHFAVGLLDLTASGPADGVAFELGAEALTAPAVGFFDKIDVAGLMDLSGRTHLRLERFTGSRAGAPFSLTAPATVTFGDGINVQDLRAAYGAEGALALDGQFSQQLWRATIAAHNLPLAAASSIISFDIALDSDQTDPARGEFRLRSLFAEDKKTEIAGSIAWNGERLSIANTAGSPLIFEIDTPLALTRTPRLSVIAEGSIRGEAAYEGALQTLVAYFPTSMQSLEGEIEAHARISGNIERPSINGRIAVRNGAYTELVSGLTLTGLHVDAAAAANADGSTINFDAGAHGPGQKTDTITFSGRVDLADIASIEAALTLDSAVFAAGPVNRATASGVVSLTGPVAAMRAAGALTIGELNADIVEPPSGGLVDIEVVTPGDSAAKVKPASIAGRAPPLSLAIEVAADDRVFIRGRGLESEWSANIQALGEAQSPLLLGNLTLRRGTLDFSGRRFTFSRGEIAFDRLTSNDPALNLRAEYVTRGGVTTAIEVGGRASKPSVSLVSSPSLPPEDIMALILFGKPARELSALESLQVAQALAQLSGVGPFGSGGGVTDIARRTLGLDLLNISVDSDAGASSLEVGKYVAEGLFVAAKQDARGENGSVRVEYEITDSISIETEMRQDGEQTVSANWKRDF